MKPTPISEIEYPETDGEPIAETEIHFDHTVRLHRILQHRCAGERVYVGADLLCYWIEGDRTRSVAPDVFVVLDCPPEPPRRTFRTWEEGRVPNFVVELTSSSTMKRDVDTKPGIYAEMGVGEYFLYDPTADYLDPIVQGYRLEDGEYVRIEPDTTGRLRSEELGIDLSLADDGTLELLDAKTGKRLLTDTEAAELQRDGALAEVERLRKLLDERDDPT